LKTSRYVRYITDADGEGVYIFSTVSKLPQKTGRQARMAALSSTEQESLLCQSCASVLTYIPSIVAGAQPAGDWDRYICRHCGTAFEYRPHTQNLKRA
jgi:hypothetical protein